MFLVVTAFLSACSGIVAYFSGDLIFPIVAAGITLILSVTQVVRGIQNGFKTEIATVIIGLIISLIFKLPKLATIALSLCIAEVAVTLIGWIMLFINRNKYESTSLYSQTNDNQSSLEHIRAVSSYEEKNADFTYKSPEIIGKENELEQINQLLLSLHGTVSKARDDLGASTEEDALEMQREGIITNEQAQEFIDSIGVLKFIIDSTSKSIAELEKSRNALIEEIQSIK